MMHWKGSIISFILAVIVGLGVTRAQLLVDRLWPSFTKEEVAAKVGRRVRLQHTEKFSLMKCPEEEGVCKVVQEGESGTIIRIVKVPDGGYFLEVRWDEPADGYFSYFGRYSHRESLIEL